MDRRRRLATALVVSLLVFAPLAARPAGAADAPQAGTAKAASTLPVEGFMALTGRLVVGEDRRVSAYVIDHAAKVPDEVRAFLDRRIANWRVEFDAGTAPTAEAVRFHVRLRASAADDGLYRLWLDGVHVDEPLPAAQQLVATRTRRPDYPRAMGKVRASGIVYMLALVGADGRVEDVFAEQVDLTAVPADPADFIEHQLEFIASAAGAVRQWRFRVPAEGPYAAVPQVVRIPLVFAMHDRPTAYGEWEYLVRGVRKSPPWRSASVPDATSALASTGMQPARSRIRVVDAGEGRGG
jgi:hypothetical protein